MSDTPETAAIAARIEHSPLDACMGYPRMAMHARSLERRMNEARALAEKYRNLAAGTQQQADEHRLPWETITNQQP